MESTEIKRVLVTGQTGYIGPVVTRLLLEAGYEVAGLDTGYFAECVTEADPTKVAVAQKDLRDLRPADLAGIDAVVHLAALSNDPMGELQSDWTYDINHTGSVNLAKAAKEAGVKRFLFSSSCSIYGASGDEMATEESPLQPLSAYAVSKVKTEEDLDKLANGSFSPAYLRNATAYGASPRTRLDLVVNNLTAWAFTTGKIRIMSDGTPWRPLVHIEDIARAFLALLQAPRDVIHNQPFNVGADTENYRVKDVADLVSEAIPGCEITYTGESPSDPRNYRVSFAKINRMVPAFQAAWNVGKGAVELRDAFQRVNLTLEDFQGRNYIRLKQLRHLIDSDALDNTLRWKTAKAASV